MVLNFIQTRRMRVILLSFLLLSDRSVSVQPGVSMALLTFTKITPAPAEDLF